jgi:UDP-glucose 4-epimerase
VRTRVVVGGGCGFFGSYLVPPLVENGAQVTVVDNLENGERSAIDSARGDVAFIEADLRDRSVCDELLRGVDLFINLAANASGVGFSRTHHGDMLVDKLVRTTCGTE